MLSSDLPKIKVRRSHNCGFYSPISRQYTTRSPLPRATNTFPSTYLKISQVLLCVIPKKLLYINHSSKICNTHTMEWTPELCCNFTLFFFILMLSRQLYTCIQPSSVPSHIVGWLAVVPLSSEDWRLAGDDSVPEILKFNCWSYYAWRECYFE